MGCVNRQDNTSNGDVDRLFRTMVKDRFPIKTLFDQYSLTHNLLFCLRNPKASWLYANPRQLTSVTSTP